MEQNKNQEQPPKINMQTVGELSRQLLRKRTSKVAFRLNMTLEWAYYYLTAHYVTEVNHRGLEYIDSPNTRMAIYNLAKELTANNPRCGVMLCGTCGNGKTTLVHALREFIWELRVKNHFKFMGEYFVPELRIFDAKDLLRKFNNKDDWRTVNDLDLVAIDDFGKEPTEVLEYGNPRSPLVDLLEQRYQRQKFTIITTNLAPNEMEAKYGARLADRFREMFEVIAFEFSSYRGKSERRQT